MQIIRFQVSAVRLRILDLKTLNFEPRTQYLTPDT